VFKYDIKYIEKKEHNNQVLSKQMEVWNLHIFLILDTFEEKIANLLLNKIIDVLVEDLVEKDVYNSFSDTLEKINKFLKEIKIVDEDEEDINETSLLIGILDDKWNLHFSKTWKASSYLIRNLNEISEITDKKSNFENFTFVSSWKLEKGDLIVFSNKRLLNYLAKSDLIDIWERKDLEKSNQWVANILQYEKTKSNISFLSLKFYWNEDETKKIDGFIPFLIEKWKTFFQKPQKNLTKVYKRISKQNKLVKNIFFILWIFVSIYILYFIVAKVIYEWSLNTSVEETQIEVTEARDYIGYAIEAKNWKDHSNFNINIKKAEEITQNIIKKKILKNETDLLIRDIASLKQDFNNVKIFGSNDDNLVAKTSEKNTIKIIENRNKVFVIWEDKIIWPIISWKVPVRNIFNKMTKWDKFIDAISVWENILLLTKENRVVKFSRNKNFSYVKVIWQKKWQQAHSIKKFASNIYLIGDDNQIYKHKLAWANSYTSGEAYLRKQDVLQIGKIMASWIDWWIYILKEDLSLIKFFKKWNVVESIMLNKFPLNYNLEKENSKIDIIIPEKSKFVFFFLNNKIWVTKPNSTNYESVKNLTFLWQIEANKFSIKSFVVKGNSEILILNENWVYKFNFWVKEKDDWTLDLVLN